MSLKLFHSIIKFFCSSWATCSSFTFSVCGLKKAHKSWWNPEGPAIKSWLHLGVAFCWSDNCQPTRLHQFHLRFITSRRKSTKLQILRCMGRIVLSCITRWDTLQWWALLEFKIKHIYPLFWIVCQYFWLLLSTEYFSVLFGTYGFFWVLFGTFGHFE